MLRMDLLGTIAFDEGDAAIDATLYDSRVCSPLVVTWRLLMSSIERSLSRLAVLTLAAPPELSV